MTEDRARLRAQDILDPYTECSCPEGWNSCPWCKWGELITAALLSAEATARREGERAGREAMREEAAQHHDRMKGIGTRAFEEQHRHDAIAIRALPISTTGGE